MPPGSRCFTLIATTVLLGFHSAQSNLMISSGGADYTNGTFYAPFGSSITVLCEGGLGEKRWYVVGFGGIQVFLPTDSTQDVYQSSGQLIVGDFQQSEEEQVFCEDEQGSTVYTNLAESVIITSASVTSTSITVFWELPSRGGSSDKGVLLGSCCMVKQPNNCGNNNEVKISDGNFSVDGLEEFTSYSCYIPAFSVAYVAATLSGRPTSPPGDVQLLPISSTSLRLEWGLPVEQGRNGIITQYIVECTGIASVQSPVVLSSPTFNTPPYHQQLLTGLASFTEYSCRVAAANVNGTGPFSALASSTTLEGLPGPVSNVRTSRVSDEAVFINWSTPKVVNGILRRYILVYGEYNRSSTAEVELNVTQPDTSLGINGLSAGVPYSAVVYAVNGAGRGAESEQVTFFAKELRPTRAVLNVAVIRVSDSEMEVRWTELSLREARGYPVYTVLYEPSSGSVGEVGTSRQEVGVRVAMQPPVIISGLDPGTTYTVQVRVDTNETVSNGSGPLSERTTTLLFTHSTSPSIIPVLGASVGVVAAVLLVVMVIVVAAVVSRLLWRRSRKYGPSTRDAAAPDYVNVTHNV